MRGSIRNGQEAIPGSRSWFLPVRSGCFLVPSQQEVWLWLDGVHPVVHGARQGFLLLLRPGTPLACPLPPSSAPLHLTHAHAHAHTHTPGPPNVLPAHHTQVAGPRLTGPGTHAPPPADPVLQTSRSAFGGLPPCNPSLYRTTCSLSPLDLASVLGTPVRRPSTSLSVASRVCNDRHLPAKHTWCFRTRDGG